MSKKNKINVNDKIIVLRKNKTITVHGYNEIHNIIQDKDVMYLIVLIDSRSLEYVSVKRESFMYPFRRAQLKCDMSFDSCYSRRIIYDAPISISIEINNAIDFYRMIHGICVTDLINNLRGSGDAYCDSRYTFSNAELLIDADGTTNRFFKGIDMEGYTLSRFIGLSVDSMYQGAGSMESIRCGIPPCIISLEHATFSTVKDWKKLAANDHYDDKINMNNLYSIWLMYGASTTFISGEYLNAIRLIDFSYTGCSMNVVIYHINDDNHIPCKMDINYSDIYDYDRDGLIIYQEMIYDIQDYIYLTEILCNFKRLYSHFSYVATLIYPHTNVNILLNISYRLKGRRLGLVSEYFHFTKNSDTINNDANIYDEFIRDLERNIQGYVEGKDMLC